MNTLRVFILTLLLVATAIKLDSRQMNAAGWFSSVAIAAVFAVASNDTSGRRSKSKETRATGACVTSSAAWAGQNSCVLCGGHSS
jgi:hypothetical protein